METWSLRSRNTHCSIKGNRNISVSDKKAITKTGVTIRQPLNQPCAVNDPIVRIVRGQIGGAGDYLLRLRITDDSDTYLVRYVVNGQTYYQTVNSQETERELGK